MTTIALDPRRLAVRIGIGAVFVLAFGWELDGALNDYVFIAGFASAAHRPLSGFAWVVLALGFAIPVLGFVIGIAVGVRRTAGRFALVLLAAFCASEALTLALLTLSVLTLFQSAVGAG